MLGELEIKARVSDGMNEIIQRNDSFNDFYEKASDMGDLFLVGGAIRDFTFQKEPNDLDIIVDCTPEELLQLMKEFNCRKNRFEGYKLNFNDIEIDVWSINNHWAFKENLYDCSFNNITKGAFFNFDAIAIDLQSYELDADAFINSYQNKILDLNLSTEYVNLNPDPEKNIRKAYKLKETMNLDFSNRLLEYFREWDYCIK